MIRLRAVREHPLDGQIGEITMTTEHPADCKKNSASRKLITIGVVLVAFLVAWPEAKQLAVERLVRTAIQSDSKMANNGFANVLGSTIGAPIARAALESAPLDRQVEAVGCILIGADLGLCTLPAFPTRD
jgi:hypothetical protein